MPGQPNNNYLVKIAPEPPACAQAGQGPCRAYTYNGNPGAGGQAGGQGVTQVNVGGSNPAGATGGGGSGGGGGGSTGGATTSSGGGGPSTSHSSPGGQFPTGARSAGPAPAHLGRHHHPGQCGPSRPLLEHRVRQPGSCPTWWSCSPSWRWWAAWLPSPSSIAVGAVRDQARHLRSWQREGRVAIGATAATFAATLSFGTRDPERRGSYQLGSRLRRTRPPPARPGRSRRRNNCARCTSTRALSIIRTFAVSVSDTTELRNRQVFRVGWTGAHPTGGTISDEQSATAATQEYPVVLDGVPRGRLARACLATVKPADVLDRHPGGADGCVVWWPGSLEPRHVQLGGGSGSGCQRASQLAVLLPSGRGRSVLGAVHGRGRNEVRDWPERL